MSHMQRLPENLGPEGRRVCWRWVGSVLAFYGALIIITVRIAVGNQFSTILAKEPAVAASERLPVHIGAAPPMRQLSP
jgi:hypothetical protein